MREGFDRFGRVEAGAQAPAEGAEGGFALECALGTEAQDMRGPVVASLWFHAGTFAAADTVAGAEPQPTAELFVALPAGHIEPNFADQGLDT